MLRDGFDPLASQKRTAAMAIAGRIFCIQPEHSSAQAVTLAAHKISSVQVEDRLADRSGCGPDHAAHYC
jgi:hypothetical protein